MIASTRAGSTPCLTVAITMKLEPSCEVNTPALTLSTSLSSCTRRLSRREDLAPPSTRASTCSWSTSTVPVWATFQAR